MCSGGGGLRAQASAISGRGLWGLCLNATLLWLWSSLEPKRPAAPAARRTGAGSRAQSQPGEPQGFGPQDLRCTPSRPRPDGSAAPRETLGLGWEVAAYSGAADDDGRGKGRAGDRNTAPRRRRYIRTGGGRERFDAAAAPLNAESGAR